MRLPTAALTTTLLRLGTRLDPWLIAARPNRLHDRLVYRREGAHWTIGRLAP